MSGEGIRSAVNARNIRVLAWSALAALVGVSNAHAQAHDAFQNDRRRINIYRYILDVDVPESAAMMALDKTPGYTLRAAAPKPIAIHALWSLLDAAAALSIDVSPYYAAGGGVRALSDYMNNSVRGRLTRVLTKSLISLAAVGNSPDKTRIGFGVRSTIHDPHDPIFWGIADSAALVQNAAAVSIPGVGEESDIAHTPGMKELYARAAVANRGRCCIQVALGYAASVDVEGAAIDADSAGRFRHHAWFTFQRTLDARYDILVTPRYADADQRHFGLGIGLQRKGPSADIRADVYYDGAQLHPALRAETPVVAGLRLVSAFATRTAPDGRTELVASAQISAYAASRF